MPRKLKTYLTSIGFFDLAIAAPSMKAAADAWGSDTNVFKKGFAMLWIWVWVSWLETSASFA